MEMHAQGRFRTFSGLTFEDLTPRSVTVFLPDAYASDRRYPVLYMHDGKNLFAPERASFGVDWGLHRTVDRLTAEGLIAPHIVVGIDNTDQRTDDYTPDADPSQGGGGGERYLDFLVEVVKPLVDAEFATMADRASTRIGGSSLGALISLHAAIRHPTVFGRVAAMSPALWWNRRSMLARMQAYRGQLPDRLWLDVGVHESETTGAAIGSMLADVRQALRIIESKGRSYGTEVAMLEDIEGHHDEASWRRRLDAVLAFVLGDRAASEPRTLTLSLLSAVLTANGPAKRAAITAEARYGGRLRMTVPADRVALRSEDPDTIRVRTGGIIEGRAVGTAAVVASHQGVEARSRVEVCSSTTAEITFEVRAPAVTKGPVFIAADQPALGAWRADGLRLKRSGGDLWTASVRLRRGSALEYKATLGTWQTVEKHTNGGERPNRTYRVAGDARVRLEVEEWAEG